MASKVAAIRTVPGKDICERYTYSMHMQVQINLELPDFRQALASLMPKGVEINSLELDQKQLVLQGRAPLIGAVTLTAKVKVVPNRLTLSGFDLKGAGLMKALVLSQLRQKLTELEYSNPGMRFWGDCDGSFAYLSWS